MVKQIKKDTFPIIPSLGICVNNQCNLSCVYCPPNGEDIFMCNEVCNIDSIISLIKVVRNKNFQVVRLTGGEPLLTPQRSEKILKESVLLKFGKIIFNTNGVNLIKELNWLAKYKNDFECKVSLDTLSRKTYIELTGSDSINKVLNGLTKAKELGLNITINIVVTKLNIDEIFNVLDYCEINEFNVKIFDMFNFTKVFEKRWEEYYFPVDSLTDKLDKKYNRIGKERLPGDRGLSMAFFKFNNGKKILLVNHHGKKRGSRVFSSVCKKCPNYPCASGRFQLPLRSDGLLSTCRLRPDLGCNISGKDEFEINQIVDNLLNEFNECTYV